MTQPENRAYNGKIALYRSTINTIPLETLLIFLHTENLLKAVLDIAVLEPKKTAFTLEHMPEHISKPILAELARGIRLETDVYEQLLADAAETLQHIQLEGQRHISVGFMAEFEDTMQVLNHQTVKSVVSILEETDTERARELRSAIITFEDLLLLDDRSIQKVLREAEFEECAAALLIAPETIKQKIKCNMSIQGVARLEKCNGNTIFSAYGKQPGENARSYCCYHTPVS